MSNPSKAAQGSAATAKSSSFKDKSFWQKTVFVGKAVIFFVTCGFAYPNIFMD